MGALANRLRRGLTNRAFHQISSEVGSFGPGSAMYAVAIAAAVYPDAIYDSEDWDQFNSVLPQPIVNQSTATGIAEAWIDRAEMSWDECLILLYGCDPTESTESSLGTGQPLLNGVRHDETRAPGAIDSLVTQQRRTTDTNAAPWMQLAGACSIALGALGFIASAGVGGGGTLGGAIIAGALNPLFFVGVPLGIYWLRQSTINSNKTSRAQRKRVVQYKDAASQTPERQDDQTSSSELSIQNAKTADAGQPRRDDTLPKQTGIAEICISLGCLVGVFVGLIGLLEFGASDSYEEQEVAVSIAPRDVNEDPQLSFSGTVDQRTGAGSKTPTPGSPPPTPDKPSTPPTTIELATLSKALKTASAAFGEGSFADAAKQINLARNAAKLDKHKQMVERLNDVGSYVKDFHKALRDGSANLESGVVFLVGESTVVTVVECGLEHIVLRVAGTNRRYLLNDMPLGLAVAIANRSLDQTAPSSKVLKGAYVLVHKRRKDTDLVIARNWWKDAAADGAKLGDLIKIFDDDYDKLRISPPQLEQALESRFHGVITTVSDKNPQLCEVRFVADDVPLAAHHIGEIATASRYGRKVGTLGFVMARKNIAVGVCYDFLPSIGDTVTIGGALYE